MYEVIKQKETYLVCWLDVDFYFFSSQSLDDDDFKRKGREKSAHRGWSSNYLTLSLAPVLYWSIITIWLNDTRDLYSYRLENM